MNEARLNKLARPKTATNGSLRDGHMLNEEVKKKELQKKELVRLTDENGELPLIFQKNPVFLIFENKLQAELFNARSHDTGEHIASEKAKIFKEEFNRINLKKVKNVLNLYSMRLGVNCMITLSNLLQEPKMKDIDSLNLADNAISDNGMHSIKTMLSNTRIRHLNLSSNMISDSGLEMIVDDLSKSTLLNSLDLGVHPGSIRKNSFGIDGAKCIAAVILQNKNITTIRLQDNDIGITGGEIIGTALKQNKTLRHLTISENELKTAGAEFILKAAANIESLDLGKNFIKPQIGGSLRAYLETNHSLKRLNLEFNELLVSGMKELTNGLMYSRNLIELNLRGNGIKDEGLHMISQVLGENTMLENLDVSLNEITPIGVSFLAEVLPRSGIKTLNLSKNLLGDESLMVIAEKAESAEGMQLQRIDVNSSRIADAGILHFLERIDCFENIKSIRATDNFISEKIEKVLLEILERNQTLTDFAVQGNRLSLCCMNRVKKILERNNKEAEEKEPNKIRTEIYRLKYEQQKIEAARRKLDSQEKVINDLESQKNMLEHKLMNLKKTEEYKRTEMSNKLVEQRAAIQKKRDLIEEKNAKFEMKKQETMAELAGLQEEYAVVETERKKVFGELEQLNHDIDAMEEDFKNQLDHVDNEVVKQKAKKDEFEKKSAELNVEYSMLLKLEKELTEQVLAGEKAKAVKKANKRSSMVGSVKLQSLQSQQTQQLQ